MSSKLYVGNLAFSITEDQLREAFSKFGNVESVKIVTDETGRSKGFGFVEMSTDEEADKAVKGLNGTELFGRAVKVDLARPKEFRPRDTRGGSGHRGGGRKPYY